MTIQPPKYAQYVLQTLENAGYQAYFVGGSVRDMLLQRRPQDWDACTDALPEQVMACFPKTEPTGLKHGTVTVLSGGHRIEVTTFRTEGSYSDHRRPESVQFVPDLKEDLRRRDFTVNAMALSLRGGLTDLFGGRDDLAHKIIRCVGDPEMRFNEDALRMLRALRFSAKLDFEIEENTKAAILRCAPLAAALAPERISVELEQILRSKKPETAALAFRWGLMDAYVSVREDIPDLRSLKRLPKTTLARWTGLCALLEISGILQTEKFLRQLRLPTAVIRGAASGVMNALDHAPSCALDWKKILAFEGEDTAYCTASAVEALGSRNAFRTLESIRMSGECVSLRQLAVDGKTLLERGYKGTEVGSTLHRLLEHVLEHPEDNTTEKLMGLI